MFTGEKGSGEFLIATARLVTENDVVIKGSSHWLMDEAPDQGAPRLVTSSAAESFDWCLPPVTAHVLGGGTFSVSLHLAIASGVASAESKI